MTFHNFITEITVCAGGEAAGGEFQNAPSPALEIL
jgi:hypothetical protein